MTGGRIGSYENPDAQQRPLLRFTQSADGRRSRHRLLLLLLPCLRLADDAHPLRAPADADRRQWVRERAKALLSELPDPADGSIDDRWEWAIPLLLDPGLREFLEQWKTGALSGLNRNSLVKPNPELFDRYVDDLLRLDADQLGRRPPHLAELVAEVALGSPAVLAARSLGAFSGRVTDTTRCRLAVVVASAFWSLFNRPAVISMLRRSAGKARPGDGRRLLAAGARLLPQRQPAGGARRTAAPAVGPALLDARRRPGRDGHTLRAPSSCRGSVPSERASTPVSSRPRPRNLPSARATFASARSSRCASATCAVRTAAVTSARTP